MLLLSPSGAGLEDMAAMHGDASQLQSHLVQLFSGRARQGHPDFHILSFQCCMLITWALLY